jgi:hypothetical protein
MIYRSRLLAALTVVAVAPAAWADEVPAGFKTGTPELKAAGALAFGPDGILFVADAPAGTVYAIATGDTKPAGTKSLKVEKLDEAIGGLLGTTGSEVVINDMKVNPASGNVYLSGTRGKGPGSAAVLVKVGADGKPTEVPLKDVKYSSVKVNNTAAGRYPAITSIVFHKGDLYVAGMTTEEWASNLKAIPFPFSEAAAKGAGVQIYHAAHGAWETKAPIQTFMAYEINGQPNLVASYVCTPLVKFPVEKVKAGDKVKGTTVAELGNMNRPLDIVAYQKDGKDYALMANDRRGVMKVALEGIDKIEELTTPVRGGGTAGLKYDSIKELEGVTQLDKLNADTAVVLKKTGANLALVTVALP